MSARLRCTCKASPALPVLFAAAGARWRIKGEVPTGVRPRGSRPRVLILHLRVDFSRSHAGARSERAAAASRMPRRRYALPTTAPREPASAAPERSCGRRPPTVTRRFESSLARRADEPVRTRLADSGARAGWPGRRSLGLFAARARFLLAWRRAVAALAGAAMRVAPARNRRVDGISRAQASLSTAAAPTVTRRFESSLARRRGARVALAGNRRAR